jgi:hypothetical protein
MWIRAMDSFESPQRLLDIGREHASVGFKDHGIPPVADFEAVRAEAGRLDMIISGHYNTVNRYVLDE